MRGALLIGLLLLGLGCGDEPPNRPLLPGGGGVGASQDGSPGADAATDAADDVISTFDADSESELCPDGLACPEDSLCCPLEMGAYYCSLGSCS